MTRRRLVAWLGRAPWLELGRELAALVGLGAILYGLAQWSGPAAWIVGGSVAILPFGLAQGRAWRRSRR